MTMLELLELQARARAIRSQLALEPVTKIDLGESDEEAAAENGDSHKPAQSSSSKSQLGEWETTISGENVGKFQESSWTENKGECSQKGCATSTATCGQASSNSIV